MLSLTSVACPDGFMIHVYRSFHSKPSCFNRLQDLHQVSTFLKILWPNHNFQSSCSVCMIKFILFEELNHTTALAENVLEIVRIYFQTNDQCTLPDRYQHPYQIHLPTYITSKLRNCTIVSIRELSITLILIQNRQC